MDTHHTIEDTGIVLGQAIGEAVGDKKGIRRFGSAILPMDETLVLCAVDLSGRPYLQMDTQFTGRPAGRHGHRNGAGVFLCDFLCGGHEPAF